jgi:hypothetical protein
MQLFKQGALLPASPLKYSLSVFAHGSVSTQISGSCLRPQTPLIGVLSHQIVYPPGLAFPGGIFPWTADCRHEFETRHFARDELQLIAISEFPRATRTQQKDSLWLPGSGLPPDFQSRYNVRA